MCQARVSAYPRPGHSPLHRGRIWAYFQGVGGAGAPPFAIITEPSLCVATTVFKLIAPTKTSIERNSTISLRDIVPPVRNNPGGMLALCAPMSRCSDSELVLYRSTYPAPLLSPGFRLARGSGKRARSRIV